MKLGPEWSCWELKVTPGNSQQEKWDFILQPQELILPTTCMIDPNMENTYDYVSIIFLFYF